MTRGTKSLIVAALLALAISACGGGSSDDSNDSSQASTTSTSAGPGGAGRTDDRRSCSEQKASQDCGVEAPNAPVGGGNFDPAAIREQLGQYVACLRENGYEPPQPDPSGRGRGFDPSRLRDDPKFQAASAKCEHLFPRPPGGAPPGQ